MNVPEPGKMLFAQSDWALMVHESERKELRCQTKNYSGSHLSADKELK
jgi:hypothetical protein